MLEDTGAVLEHQPLPEVQGELHANAYVAKPVGFERFVSVVQQIDDFFTSLVKPPSRG